MKRIIISIIISLLLGLTLGYIFISKYTKSIEDNISNQVYAIQIGVYKNYDNAYNISTKYNGIIVKDDNYYRVYIDIIKDKDILETMKTYYKNNNITYYLKPININTDFNNRLDEYELLLKNTSDNNYDIINNKIIKEYEKYEL